MKKIILINGKKRSGKDFFANLLYQELEKRGKTTKIISFADPIKDILAASFNISVEEFNEFKNLDPEITIADKTGARTLTSFRPFIQTFGTEAMRKYFGDSVWVDLMKSEINKLDVDFIIIPDFRFLIEDISTDTIKIFNEVLISDDSHISENELEDFNFKFNVDNTNHPDLSKQVENSANYFVNMH